MSDTDPPPDASVSEVVRDLKIAHSDEYLFMRFSLALPKEVLLNGNAGLRIYLNGRGETGVAVPFHGSSSSTMTVPIPSAAVDWICLMPSMP